MHCFKKKNEYIIKVIYLLQERNKLLELLISILNKTNSNKEEEEKNFNNIIEFYENEYNYKSLLKNIHTKSVEELDLETVINHNKDIIKQIKKELLENKNHKEHIDKFFIENKELKIENKSLENKLIEENENFLLKKKELEDIITMDKILISQLRQDITNIEIDKDNKIETLKMKIEELKDELYIYKKYNNKLIKNVNNSINKVNDLL